MDFALAIELNTDKALVTNFDEVKQQIVDKLTFIRDKCPVYE